jgi:hypothetical protein
MLKIQIPKQKYDIMFWKFVHFHLEFVSPACA